MRINPSKEAPHGDAVSPLPQPGQLSCEQARGILRRQTNTACPQASRLIHKQPVCLERCGRHLPHLPPSRREHDLGISAAGEPVQQLRLKVA